MILTNNQEQFKTLVSDEIALLQTLIKTFHDSTQSLIYNKDI